MEAAKQNAPADAITGPIFLHPASLELVLSRFAGAPFSQPDFTEAVRTAYVQVAGSAAGKRHPIVLSDPRDVFISSNSTDPDGEKSYSIADAGISMMIRGVTPAGEGAEVKIAAIFSDTTRHPLYMGHGLGHILVRMSLVRENGQWRTRSSKVFHAVG